MKIRTRTALLFLLTLFLGPAQSFELSVEQAYQAIPHNRTVFEASASKLSVVHAAGLKQLLELSDRALVLRITAMQAFTSHDSQEVERTLWQYATLLRLLNSLEVPTEIKSTKALITESIILHQRYFQESARNSDATGKFDLAYRTHPLVLQASRKLQMAYGQLIQTFPSETATNRQAFYDYLCALDFI